MSGVSRRLSIERWTAWFLVGLVAWTTSPGRAETRLEGQADDIQLQMSDASVREILATLEATYDVRFRSAIPLDHRITGTIKGPLPRVLTRVLDGYDYVVKSTNGATEVVVFATRSGQGQAQHPASPVISLRRVPSSPSAATMPDRANIPSGQPLAQLPASPPASKTPDRTNTSPGSPAAVVPPGTWVDGDGRIIDLSAPMIPDQVNIPSGSPPTQLPANPPASMAPDRTTVPTGPPAAAPPAGGWIDGDGRIINLPNK